MTSVHIVHALFTAAAVTALGALLAPAPAAGQPAGTAPLTLASATVSLAGTSNVHDYTASTTTVRLTRTSLGPQAADRFAWDAVQTPTGLTGFDLSIPAATLHCTRDGVDKNMHKALQVEAYPDITFSLVRLEGAPGTLTAVGTLRIAGVSREVRLPLETTVSGVNLAVRGGVDLHMPDYGIKPPTAMLGVVRASPKVRVTFDVVLAPAVP